MSIKKGKLNFMSFMRTLLVVCVSLLTSTFAFADEASSVGSDPYKSLAAAFAIGIASLGGAIGQAKTAASALEAIGRNPAAQDKIRTPMILGLVLIESLVLYAFVIAFKLT
jgi:F-type H+-transporting ATPase subunit c